jgi:hypothetical protein
LPRGSYRLDWTADVDVASEAGAGQFYLDRQVGTNRRTIAGGHVPMLRRGEYLLSLHESSRHIFYVRASMLTWELKFTAL